jgi:hypothetical protein
MAGDKLVKLGKPDAAQPYYDKTIVIEEAILGKNHPVVKALHEKLAFEDLTCWQRSTLRKSMAVLYEGLQMEKKANKLLKLDQKKLAKDELERVLKIEEEILGEQHPMTISLQEKIILSTT